MGGIVVDVMYEVIVDKGLGSTNWYLNDKLHREDGPAIEYANGGKYWYLNDKLHREDGPAVERANGDKEWWLDGRNVTEQEAIGTSLVGKVVIIDGVEYVLGEVKL